MNLKYDPFRFIFAQGDETTQLICLEFFGLAGSSRARGCLSSLVQQQRADGAFPSRLDPAAWGTRETVRNVLLLLKAGMPPDGANVDSAVQFLLSHQRPDGGWCENPSLEIPSHVVELSNEQSVTWLTADAVELLRQVGMGDGAECRAALEWLRQMQNPHGGWHCFRGSIGDRRGTTGDPDSTAQVAFLMGDIYGQDDPAYQKGRALYERSLDECVADVEQGYRVRLRDGQRVELDAYTLTQPILAWALEPPRRVQAGYDVREPRVRRILEALLGIQREDGGWRPFWEEGSSPLYTVLAIEVLALGGALARDALRDKIGAYTT
jgi:squalene cyclase